MSIKQQNEIEQLKKRVAELERLVRALMEKPQSKKAS